VDRELHDPGENETEPKKEEHHENRINKPNGRLCTRRRRSNLCPRRWHPHKERLREVLQTRRALLR
jgi:hypothetical protein